MSLIRRTACARAQFNGCSSTTNSHSETGQMAVCCQTLTLGALSSRSALSLLVGALFKKFGLFLNTPCICIWAVASFDPTRTSALLTYISPRKKKWTRYNKKICIGIHVKYLLFVSDFNET
jgi:hypothetical protein